MLRKKSFLLLASFSALSLALSSAYAKENSPHYLIAPKCLLKKVSSSYQTLSSNSSLALIQGSDETAEQLMEAKHQRTASPCGGFMDVTQAWNDLKVTKTNKAATLLKQYSSTDAPVQNLAKKESYKIQYQKQVEPLIKEINTAKTWEDLTKLTSFKDRYANSDTGVEAAEWIRDRVLAIAADAHRTDVSSFFVKTTNTAYKQPSLVVKLGNSDEPGIIIGGHMDTLRASGEIGKPGADDDGSGTVTVMSVARTILESGMTFNKPIYFIWYAAEEEGLLGSASVVKHFKEKKIPVSAVLQFDMTGYAYQNEPTMWLINDYVNKNLTQYIEKLITTYVKQPVSYTRCGYACSDHASWYYGGFAAAFPFESSFGHDDPYIHTSNDTQEKLSLQHINDFAKLGTSFAVELAEPAA